MTEVLPPKSQEARLFYLREAVTRLLGTRELRQLIVRKAFEMSRSTAQSTPSALNTASTGSA